MAIKRYQNLTLKQKEKVVDGFSALSLNRVLTRKVLDFINPRISSPTTKSPFVYFMDDEKLLKGFINWTHIV